MARTSSTSNPTGLVEIDRQDVGLVLNRLENKRFISLVRLDLAKYKLINGLAVTCIARSGNATQRIELGTLPNIDKSAHEIDQIDSNAPLKFRLVLRTTRSPKLVASCENIRVRDDSDADSLLPMEAVDNLGDVIWELEVNEDGPVLLFNRDVFASSAAALNYPPFRALVIPEAFRQICRRILDDLESLHDEASPWFAWRTFFEHHGIDLPNAEDTIDEAAWAREAATLFAEHSRLLQPLRRHMEATND